MRSRLEYKEGKFHSDNGTHEANTYGWQTIDDGVPADMEIVFCGVFEEHFNCGIFRDKSKTALTIDEVRLHWELFKRYWKFMEKFKNIK